MPPSFLHTYSIRYSVSCYSLQCGAHITFLGRVGPSVASQSLVVIPVLVCSPTQPPLVPTSHPPGCSPSPNIGYQSFIPSANKQMTQAKGLSPRFCTRSATVHHTDLCHPLETGFHSDEHLHVPTIRVQPFLGLYQGGKRCWERGKDHSRDG